MTSYPSVYNITPSIFMTSYPIHMLSPYCFNHDTTTIPDISPTIIDVTATVSVSSHRWHTHLYRCIALLMTSHVCKSSHLAHEWHHTQSKSHHIHSLWHQWSCFMTQQTLYSWHQISSVWHHIHSLGHHTTLWMTSRPLYLTSRPFYLCHQSHPIDDITATIWMVSHPVYLWYHIPCIYDIMSTKYDITTLCVEDTILGICVTSVALQMTSHTLYHPKPEYLWCYIHFRHDITPPVSDIKPTVSLSSQTLHWYHTQFWMTSHPASEWHHMHYIEHHVQYIISYTLYKALPPHFMTSHHVIYDITFTVFMTSPPLYLKWHSPYLCHHNDSFDGLRPTLCVTSHPLYVCQLMHSIQLHIHCLWFQTILFITLHPLNSWNHTPYIWHHTHSNTNVISAIWPLYLTLQPLYLCHQ